MTNIFTLKDEAERESYSFFDKNIRELHKDASGEVDRFALGLADNDVDAFRHAYTSGVYTQEYNALLAEKFGLIYEYVTGNSSSVGGGNSGRNMDLWNNSIGREYGKKSKSRKDLAKQLQEAMEKGEFITDPADPRRYEGKLSYKIDPEKPVIVINESKSGRNDLFVDIINGQSFDRETFVAMIEAGKYPGYMIAMFDGLATPMSKPDESEDNNLG